jgi:hypothetical protein
MSKGRVEAEAARLPLRMGLEDPGPQGLQARIQTVEGLEKAFDRLVEELQGVAEAAAPRRKANRGFNSPWWTEAVEQASREARRAEREYKRTPTDHCKERLGQSLRALASILKAEKTKSWRALLQEATDKPELLWNLERWARCRSFNPPDPPKLPALTGPTGESNLTTHEEKAKALAGKFFPNPPADLQDIRDPALEEDWEPRFGLHATVSVEDIEAALSKAGLWKAPGEDLLPIGLLKACGNPLYRVLASLATRCFQLQWFPRRFKRAKTVVLQKPGKPPATYQTPGGYRPIALLPTLGKVIEAVVARRITGAAEAYGLLPTEQMGNRVYRLTELAIRLVVA